MSKILLELEVPDEVKKIEDEFRVAAQESVLEAAVLKLFEKGEISSGYGAAMLGLTRWDFIQLLGRRGIPFINYDEEEMRREVEAAEQLSKRLTEEKQERR